MVIDSQSKTQNGRNFFSSNFAFKIKNFLNSAYSMALISIIISVFWALNIGFVSVGFMAVFFIATLVFCHDDPKAILLPVISISLMFNNLLKQGFLFVIICLSFAVIALVIYILYKAIKEKQQLKKGKLFWPYLLVLLGNALAGIIGHFELRAFLITLVLGLVLYFLYWFVLNFVKDYKNYFCCALIFLSLIIAAELFTAYAKSEDILLTFQSKHVRIGNGEINGPALFVVSGIISSFYLATQCEDKIKKILYIVLALFFDLVLLLTLSRISLAVGVIASFVYLIILFKQAKNKKPILIVASCILAVILLICCIFFEKLSSIFAFYINNMFSANGRIELWTWCLNYFKQFPIFGIGFITRDIASTAGSTLVTMGDGAYVQIMAHNTILHYLTCTGIVGLILNIPFYIQKYKILCTKFNSYKLFVLINILCIEVVSLLDIAGHANLFNMFILYLFIAFAEKDSQILKININDLGNKCMEEMLDTFDKNGNFVGVKSRSFCHGENPGVYHKPVWIWIINSKGEILVQKRAKTKKKSPCKWDMPSAGHVDSGESCLTACVRETYEELGIKTEEKDYIFLKEFVYEQGWELVQIYLLKKDIDIDNIKFKVEEVECVKWLTYNDFVNLIYSDEFCNHATEYKNWVCKVLKEYTQK